ncbi:hypothetical protein [Rummeliibacillus suwonensis]|uniref:hypothetical protein n=1 Tax=Rummeliibacillus suwonensis TaxID=1306154 RepID=UPI001AAED47E|nr:hypothetical protein [Rummeliibacillus suwonensis]MBO2535090.1 hypothetical protein [Rummeliibacillus suwonensis]
MRDLFNLLFNNIDWLFSGIGLVIVPYIFSSFKLKNNNKEQTVFNINLLKDNTEKRYVKEDGMEKEKSIVNVVVDRFVQVYEAHGIKQNQIAFFIDKEFNLQLRDFKDNASILQVLNDDLIKWTCEKFGIQRDWIDGTSEKIYGRKDYYKQIERFIDDICKIIREGEEVELYAFKDGELDRADENHDVILLLRYPIDKINSRIIYKYVPIETYWMWGYWRSRFQLKAIFFICERLHIFIRGYDLKERKKIADRVVFPEKIINDIPISITWYPDDYIDLISQSVQAKETDETEKVREYISKEKYIQYLNDCLKVNNSMN